MNRHFFKGSILGFSLAIMLSCLNPSVVAAVQKTLDVTYNEIKIFYYGKQRKPAQEPFIYNGTVYVPLRFIAETLDVPVEWDGENSEVILGDAISSPWFTAEQAKARVEYELPDYNVTYRSDLNRYRHPGPFGVYYCFEVSIVTETFVRTSCLYVNANGQPCVFYEEDPKPSFFDEW